MAGVVLYQGGGVVEAELFYDCVAGGGKFRAAVAIMGMVIGCQEFLRTSLPKSPVTLVAVSWAMMPRSVRVCNCWGFSMMTRLRSGWAMMGVMPCNWIS